MMPLLKHIPISLIGCLLFISSALCAVPDNTVRIHFNRADGIYDGWVLFPWGQDLNLKREVTLLDSIQPSGHDDFGIYFDIPIKQSAIRFGYILHTQGRKNVPGAMQFDIRKHGNEIWQYQSDPVIYAKRPGSDSDSRARLLAQQLSAVKPEIDPAKPPVKKTEPIAAKAPVYPAKKTAVVKPQPIQKVKTIAEQTAELERLLAQGEAQAMAALEAQKRSESVSQKQSFVKADVASDDSLAKEKTEQVITDKNEALNVEIQTELQNIAIRQAEPDQQTVQEKTVFDSVLQRIGITTAVPVWMWVGIAMLLFLPIVLFIFYRKQLQVIKANENNSVLHSLAAKSDADAEISNLDATLQAEDDAVDHEMQAVNSQLTPVSVAPDEHPKQELDTTQVTGQAEKVSIDNETGLPNKMLFLKKLNLLLSRSNEKEHKLALFIIDFDKFNALTEPQKAARLDLFKELVARYQRNLSATDMLCRYDDDRFVVTCEFNGDLKPLFRVAQQLLLAGSQPLQILGETVSINTSVGAAIYPDDETDTDKLLMAAEHAISYAKQKGQNQFRFISTLRDAQSKQRVALESSLRHAIENNELLLNYQPIVETKSQRIVGVEALVRWQHPDLGLIGPAQFIHVAEETGLICDLGRWALGEACMQAAKWHSMGLDLRLSVNVSMYQFNDTFYPMMYQQIDKAGFSPKYLTLDISEKIVLQRSEQHVKLLQQIRRSGVHIAVDDFGTAHSSLSDLKTFPVDEIKIDRSFIKTITSNSEDAATIAAIINLGRNRGLTVIAEGVEFEAQRKYLTQQQCELMQGSLFCEAKPAAILTALLKQRSVPIQPKAVGNPTDEAAQEIHKEAADNKVDLDVPLEFTIPDHIAESEPAKKQ